jgi:hypothetical protein
MAPHKPFARNMARRSQAFLSRYICRALVFDAPMLQIIAEFLGTILFLWLISRGER